MSLAKFRKVSKGYDNPKKSDDGSKKENVNLPKKDKK
jgi:hypothetical protein